MAPRNDPHGIVSEKAKLNTQITALSASITAWTGDSNGLRDLQTKICEASFRINRASTGGTMSGTAFAGFAIENISTS
jgi:hypothetical protein